MITLYKKDGCQSVHNILHNISTEESYTFYIYAFSRRFYPKRLTVHSGYTFFLYQYVLYRFDETWGWANGKSVFNFKVNYYFVLILTAVKDKTISFNLGVWYYLQSFLEWSQHFGSSFTFTVEKRQKVSPS